MRDIQKGRLPRLVVVGLWCLLGGVTCLASDLPDGNNRQQLNIASVVGDQATGIEPLWTSESRANGTTDLKPEHHAKETEAKTLTDVKKKLVVDAKVKPEQKYQKFKDDDSIKKLETATTSTSSTTSVTTDLSSKTTLTTTLAPMVTDAVTTKEIINETVDNPRNESSRIISLSSIPATNSFLSQQEVAMEKVGPNVTMVQDAATSRGRALNVSAPEPTNSLYANITDLSDVSMDDEDNDEKSGQDAEYSTSARTTVTPMVSTSQLAIQNCIEGNRTYTPGEKIIRGCDEKCVCGKNGRANDCRQLCTSPYVRAGRGVHDPLCEEKVIAEEPCCAVLICTADSAPEPEESCVFGNKTVPRGQRVEDGCAKICICEAGGHLKCQPRCPPNETAPSAVNQHDRCVVLADPRDACCTITLCDVTLGEHEIKLENSVGLTVNLTDAKVLNSTAIKLKLSAKKPELVTIEISDDNHVWRQLHTDREGIISNLEPAHTYYVRVTEMGQGGPALSVQLPVEVIKTNIPEKSPSRNTCAYRGKFYEVGAEWYDECISFCSCLPGGKAECATIECPTDFGLDVLDPHCLDWETVPPNFVPKAPRCCPQEVRCRNNGSCLYEGKTYKNWSQLPLNVTGCEKRCYCEMGKVSCQAECPPVPALPPPNLPCPAYRASLTHIAGDDCCLHWVCAGTSSLPSRVQVPGMNVTPALPGPLATHTFDRQSVDNRKRPNSEPDVLKPSEEPERATSYFVEDPKHVDGYPMTTEHDHFHYPMDPGHPTVPYNGPYNPDFRPTTLTFEDAFHFGGNPRPDKLGPIGSYIKEKEKVKTKLDSKKHTEPSKVYKNQAQDAIVHQTDWQFPGPLVADRLPGNAMSYYPATSSSPPAINPHEESQHATLNLGTSFGPIRTMPGVLENRSTWNIFDTRYGNSANPMNLNRTPSVIDHESLPGRFKQGMRNSEEEIPTEELYRIVNLQQPDSGLDRNPQAQQSPGTGSYESQRRVVGQKHSGTSSGSPKKTAKPQIFPLKNDKGHAVYRIHPSDIPDVPRQVQELLAQVGPHDSNPGPFQHYPGQGAVLSHNVPSGAPSPILPLHIDAHIPPPHSGITHLNHPFAAQTLYHQSGMDHHNLHPAFALPGSVPGFQIGNPSDEVTIHVLEALDENTVRLVFTVPQVLVGLHGRVELRYSSDKANYDPSTWKTQVFAPPDDLIATPQLEFELGDLKPGTEYKVKVTMKLKDLANSPSSKIYNVSTLERHADLTTLPPQISIDAELLVTEINTTWVNVRWKKFTQNELQFIDGVQLRYKENDAKVNAGTPLIHRTVTNYIIDNLKPATSYLIDIYLIPFVGQTTELISENSIRVTTSLDPDPYSFDVKVDIKTIKSMSVEIYWGGVPYPQDKYVNIYRAIYQSDSGKEDSSTFKIANKDIPSKTIISDLKPGTRYRLWSEVYLTNGKIKKTNVQDFVTKPGIVPLQGTVSQQGKLALLPTLPEGDYYGPLVIVAIVASLAILSTLILLMMLMKRRTSSKADISPRKTTSAYDNPSYKVELQQETMDL